MNAKHMARVAAHKHNIELAKTNLIKAAKQREEWASRTDLCGYCHAELEDQGMYYSGFCSSRCESLYGECSKCGAPKRGGGICFDCREP